jgi:hypothetical protein
MSSTATFKLVKDELESTVQEAQGALEHFISDPNDLAQLQSAIDLVNQARGTFVMIEDKGASMLCQELARLLTELPVQDVVEQTDKGKQCSDAISHALVILARYLEYLSLRQHGRSELLLPALNQVRKALSLVPLKDSYFYPYEPAKLLKPQSAQPFAPNQKVLLKLRRYRHMFQAAFLHVLQGKRTRAALSYMHRSVSQIDQIAANSAMAPLLWVASGALDCLAHQNAVIGNGRKQTFAHLDRQIKQLIQNYPDGFEQKPPTDLVKDFLYIIALCQPREGAAAQVAKLYRLPDPGVTDSELSEQMELLLSPGSSVMSSVSDALSEEINIVKDMVDQAALQSSGFSSKALHQALLKIADILVMVGLTSPSNVLRQQANIVGSWADQAAPSHDDLLKIADAVIYAESTMSRLSKAGQGADQSKAHKDQAAETQLLEARVALVDEAESGIVLAKRAITAFMESGGDIMHLANVNATLNGVQGGLTFLGSHDAAEIVQHCINFLEQKMMAGEGINLDQEKLEALADALSSLEFYLESLLSEQEPDPQVLKVANEAAEILMS